MGLLDELKKYVKDAMPGGLLNAEWTPQNVRNAGEAMSMIPNPVGDVASGLLAVDDLRKGDYGSAALNGLGLLPFAPGMAGMIKESKWSGDSVIDFLKQLKHGGEIVDPNSELVAAAKKLEKRGASDEEILKLTKLHKSSVVDRSSRKLVDEWRLYKNYDPSLVNPKNLYAYHASPNSFDDFSLDMIGKSNNSHSYGYGASLALNKSVAEQYGDKLYQVEIPGRMFRDLVSWDSPGIINGGNLMQFMNNRGLRQDGKTFADNYMEVYSALRKELPREEALKRLSSGLLSADIPGIKYRIPNNEKFSGETNITIFDPSMLAFERIK